jgi:hypothetical protein
MSTTRSMITSSSAALLDEKYFGENSKKSFVDTYRQLKRHGELLVGGYRELDKLISKPMDQNILAQSVVDLQLAGVLTPRPALGNPPFRPDDASDEMAPSVTLPLGRSMAFKLIDDGEEETFLTKVGISDEDEEDNPKIHGHNEQMHVSEPLGLPGIDTFSDLELSQTMPSPGLNMMGSLDFSQMTGDVSISTQEQLEAEEHATDYTYRTQSPRAIFINGCLKNKIPPITIALVRRNLTSTINLAHMGIGDKIASILAGCLSSLPHLQVLNLSDNHLTDTGLAELLDSAAQHKEIEELDISNNIVGTNASYSLGAFLASPECRLTSLKLRDANIDDSECANICAVLKSNTCLEELDLSKNLLGKDENLNLVKPSFVTGGESLALLLLNGDCPIKKLVLHWNMIRLDGARDLCNAVHYNKHLTHLDLSYNAIGTQGAEILGKCLLDNTVLRTLNVSNNSIDGIGCFTLCVGVNESTTLTELVLDGNPIGDTGCVILGRTLVSSSPHLKISSLGCDLKVKTLNSIYNPIGMCTIKSFILC